MYENYSRQSLPERKYRALLGSALCVFNSNNAFIIENILRSNKLDYSWYDLMDLEFGKIKNKVEETINNNDIYDLYSKLIEMRNRIVHSYQVTYNGKQILATKEKINNKQFIISEEYLLDFIKYNEKLSLLLHEYRRTISE